MELLYDIDIRHISVADSPWPAYKLRKLQNLKIFFFFVFFVYHLLGIEHIYKYSFVILKQYRFK